ncbi:MAG: amidohydrolase [Clostridiales bacterium]|nr:amidohydrolase [Clostridiales bacterium]
MDYTALAAEQEAYIIAMRREFHRFPEISGMEDKTVNRICNELEKMGIAYVNVPNGGVFAFLGDKRKGQTVLLRADIDALPVTESNVNSGGRIKPVVSENPGVAHTCGHDCHAAMLLGAAKVLSERAHEIPGRIVLMFERGEEGGGNIVYLHKWAYENHLLAHTSFAIHVQASLRKNKIHVFEDSAAASSVAFRISITGKTAHGSMPSEGISPIDCFVSMYQTLQTLRMRFTSPFHPVSFSIGEVHAGSASNIIPGELDFSGSFRMYDLHTGQKIKEELEHAVMQTALTYHCTARCRIIGPTLALINDRECAAYAHEKFLNCFGNDFMMAQDPSLLGESFSLTAKLWPGVIISLGIRDEESGITADQHHECYDVAEESLKLGTAAHLCYAMEFLKDGPDTEERVFKGDIRAFYHQYFPSLERAFD